LWITGSIFDYRIHTLLGSTVEEGIRTTIEQLEKRFFSVTKRAVIAALEDAYKWYKKYLEEKI